MNRQRGQVPPQLLIAGVIALAFAGVIIWAFWERSGRLQCGIDKQQAVDAYLVLADKVKQQNTAVDQLASAGTAARAKGRAALNQVAIEAAKKQVEIDYWKEQVAKPTPPAAGCADAWAEIRKALQ